MHSADDIEVISGQAARGSIGVTEGGSISGKGGPRGLLSDEATPERCENIA
jgi:hypothetical protein